MGKTVLSLNEDKFLINGKLTYSEIEGVRPENLGLLWNQRLIQGIIDDRGHRELYYREGLGYFDPEQNTKDLIASLDEWYACGLRAITVGTQGGWPVGMMEVESMDVNPFGEDGSQLDEDYMRRLDDLIRACDEKGMVVIVNLLYCAQAKKMKDGAAIRRAVKNICRHLREKQYTNIMIDVANEYDLDLQAAHPLIRSSEGMAYLVAMAKEESGGILTGSSLALGTVDKEVFDESDVIIIHGNNMTRSRLYDYIKSIREAGYRKPILCNEDSACISRVDVCLEAGASWGYYNNYTKQVPPVYWGVTEGEDTFYARRLMRTLGLPLQPLAFEEQFKLVGLDLKEAVMKDQYVVRVASEFPEQINHVTYYKNGVKLYRSYDEPFFLNTQTTWLADNVTFEVGDCYEAHIQLTDGRVIKKTISK